MPSDGVTFSNDELEKAFYSLAEGSPLKKSLQKAIADLRENVFCGEQIKKDIIPKEYVRNYKINNLWWYPLANAWRLVYSVISPNKLEILAVIIDYCNHKDYERKFGY